MANKDPGVSASFPRFKTRAGHFCSFISVQAVVPFPALWTPARDISFKRASRARESGLPDVS